MPSMACISYWCQNKSSIVYHHADFRYMKLELKCVKIRWSAARLSVPMTFQKSFHFFQFTTGTQAFVTFRDLCESAANMEACAFWLRSDKYLELQILSVMAQCVAHSFGERILFSVWLTWRLVVSQFVGSICPTSILHVPVLAPCTMHHRQLQQTAQPVFQWTLKQKT